VRRPDDDIGNGGSDADLDAGVALLCELALEELVQLGVEDTVYDELVISPSVCAHPKLGSRHSSCPNRPLRDPNDDF
jgi:hypothetical protein